MFHYEPVVSSFDDTSAGAFLRESFALFRDKGPCWGPASAEASPEEAPPLMEEVMRRFEAVDDAEREALVLTLVRHPGLMGPAPAAILLLEKVLQACDATPDHPMVRRIGDRVLAHAEQLAWVSVAIAPDDYHLRVALHFGLTWVKVRRWLSTAKLCEGVIVRNKNLRLCYDCGAVMTKDEMPAHRRSLHGKASQAKPALTWAETPSAPAWGDSPPPPPPTRAARPPYVPEHVPYTAPPKTTEYDLTDPYRSVSTQSFGPTSVYTAPSSGAGGGIGYVPVPAYTIAPPASHESYDDRMLEAYDPEKGY